MVTSLWSNQCCQPCGFHSICFFLWSCEFFLKTCGLFVYGFVLIEICLFLVLFFADFCFMDCSFQILWHFSVLMQSTPKGSLGLFFVKTCSFLACFFECAPLFFYLIFLSKLHFVKFSCQTHVGLIFLLNYLFWACSSDLLAYFCKIAWHHLLTPVSHLRARLIHISPSCWTIYRSFEIILEMGTVH